MTRSLPKFTSPDVYWPLLGFLGVIAGIIWMGHISGDSLLGHSGYDSYTLEALAWRHGHGFLPANNPGLELAIYHGHYWVSFPPLPAVTMLVLSFFFGANTPSGAVSIVYFLLGLATIYKLVRRYLPADQATLWMVFAALGGSILSIVVAGHTETGGVWFQAQLLSFFLTSLAFYLVDGDSKRGWIVGFTCLALAVGCRPFNLVFAPVLIWMVFLKTGRTPTALLPMFLPPVVVLAVYAVYNAVRFGSPLEFGHKYLPEFTQPGQKMFNPSLIPQHLKFIVQLPTFREGKLTFPLWGGWGVYLTQPILLFGWASMIVRGGKRTADITDGLVFVTTIFLALALLSHRTNGGYAYGCRYFIDLLPAMMFVVARGKARISTFGAALIGALILFNLIGTAGFETTTP
ncbi:MAG: hypothetical protein AAGC90_14025 [Curtobacterium sp.]